jgi:hypothetical protein
MNRMVISMEGTIRLNRFYDISAGFNVGVVRASSSRPLQSASGVLRGARTLYASSRV